MATIDRVITNDIINALTDRAGFDSWWHSTDHDIQDEIRDELISIVRNRIDQAYEK